MNLSPREQENESGINRREAIKRAALMLGAAVSASTFAGCMGADRPAAGSGSISLSNTQAGIVKAAADLILPKTDTPGALDVGVPEFIDLCYGKYMSAEEKQDFDKGLAAFEKAGFLKADASAQIQLLKNVDKKSRKFVRHLRELTIVGYFTAEEVAKNVLRFDPVPGKYVGCVPISETGNVLMSEPR
ncbi:gluconate 2-dehydrogenase subunit 3 family protein [Pelagicoccus mobilis]|uniref:Gluconate 2-dehydrogenase subunit 3 family protein n=1 Tax=Pelagicoccus mobilis TaxID=415221 RepID=A0A934RZ09_9BACT|nr:gluconate 2-dehydrogenase subunit 3 family protein [Pelagicoccus mobilis]MBK1880315.1 gluconate 2-dehydrogenase subunit 3 family protein [Pelagicoccus mobilis]